MRERSGPLLVGVAVLFAAAATVASFRPWPDPRKPEPAGKAEDTPRLARRPLLGVACPEPRDIRCDRVMVAIWVSEPVDALSASVEDSVFQMEVSDRLEQPTGTFWEGELQPAGLLGGVLAPPAETVTDGTWNGRQPPRVLVRVEIEDDGRMTVLDPVRVRLLPRYSLDRLGREREGG